MKVFNARTGELFRVLEDKRPKLAETKTPEQLRSLARAVGSVSALAFSPDGSLLVTCGRSFGDFARLFDFDDSRELATGPGRLKLWDVKTGALKYDLVGHSHAKAVAFSPDGSIFASAGRWLKGNESGSGAILWNPKTGTKVRTVVAETSGSAHSVAFSPDGDLLVIGSLRYDVNNMAATGLVSLAPVASGVVKWRRTCDGVGKPVAIYGGAVITLSGGIAMMRYDRNTGVPMSATSHNPDQSGHWNEFTFAKRGHMSVIAGEDDEGHGTLDVLDR